MSRPSVRIIAQSVRLPDTIGAARLRAEILIALFDLPARPPTHTLTTARGIPCEYGEQDR